MSKSRSGARARVIHRSVHYHRTTEKLGTGPVEKAAADLWEVKCAPPRGSENSFPGILFVPKEDMPKSSTYGSGVPVRVSVTQEVATVAATVFQWMFTTVGRSTMEEVYRKAGWKVKFDALEEPSTGPGRCTP